MGIWKPLVIQGFTWTGCFPSSCNQQNVSAIMTAVTTQVTQLTNQGLTLVHYVSFCPSGEPSYDTGAICTLVLCALLLLLCLIGTILDMIIQAFDDISKQNTPSPEQTNNFALQPETPFEGPQTQKDVEKITEEPPTEVKTTSEPPRFLKSSVCEVFLCFSLIRNTKKIFNTDVPPSAITSINGIRVISIWWVILGPVFLYFVLSPIVQNKIQYVEDAKKLSVMPVINAYYAVDSFFFLSGLLVAYTCLRKIAKNDGKFNWVLFYVHRFWRLTPSYMFVILFTVHVKGLISDSPYWNVYYKDPFCEDKWWTNLLYINNFYPEEFNEQCIGWTWYLANDMQFFVISPVLLVLAYRKKWRGLLISSGALLCISSITIAALIGDYDLDPVVNLKSIVRGSPELHKKAAEFDKYVYNKPYCRIQPYLIGFVLGYAIYAKYRVPIRRRGWLLAVIGWSIAFAIAMTVVYAPYQSTLPGNREWNKTENIFFGTFQRLLWGLVLAWVTYACHYGYGSYIQQFLSARFWIPLSRLTYSVYLIHMVVISFMFFATTHQVHYDLLTASYFFITATVLSYAVGFILAVVIEFPSENLENLALKLLRGERKSYGVKA
ncbi:nose resistant to fluoxetine protein 6-like isoform X2 [Dendronephthya gigantea]|nr:nose resistant to fluoxetine protein 6-like isoform X2 [Dendronephthya gigantea]